ncbi:hypothetical protein IWQ62_002654 [Dispira parvispora]|uniref:Uncharacterized protein n=1 Tax=Dispira parvispora TaxID=1520584 RepID=A0A9W8AVB1_9FUNG|nr:hypothetical protein IWQ62_002654 [Dispira parvispora]
MTFLPSVPPELTVLASVSSSSPRMPTASRYPSVGLSERDRDGLSVLPGRGVSLSVEPRARSPAVDRVRRMRSVSSTTDRRYRSITSPLMSKDAHLFHQQRGEHLVSSPNKRVGVISSTRSTLVRQASLSSLPSDSDSPLFSTSPLVDGGRVRFTRSNESDYQSSLSFTERMRLGIAGDSGLNQTLQNNGTTPLLSFSQSKSGGGKPILVEKRPLGYASGDTTESDSETERTAKYRTLYPVTTVTSVAPGQSSASISTGQDLSVPLLYHTTIPTSQRKTRNKGIPPCGYESGDTTETDEEVSRYTVPSQRNVSSYPSMGYIESLWDKIPLMQQIGGNQPYPRTVTGESVIIKKLPPATRPLEDTPHGNLNPDDATDSDPELGQIPSPFKAHEVPTNAEARHSVSRTPTAIQDRAQSYPTITSAGTNFSDTDQTDSLDEETRQSSTLLIQRLRRYAKSSTETLGESPTTPGTPRALVRRKRRRLSSRAHSHPSMYSQHLDKGLPGVVSGDSTDDEGGFGCLPFTHARLHKLSGETLAHPSQLNPHASEAHLASPTPFTRTRSKSYLRVNQPQLGLGDITRPRSLTADLSSRPLKKPRARDRSPPPVTATAQPEITNGDPLLSNSSQRLSTRDVASVLVNLPTGQSLISGKTSTSLPQYNSTLQDNAGSATETDEELQPMGIPHQQLLAVDSSPNPATVPVVTSFSQEQSMTSSLWSSGTCSISNAFPSEEISLRTLAHLTPTKRKLSGHSDLPQVASISRGASLEVTSLNEQAGLSAGPSQLDSIGRVPNTVLTSTISECNPSEPTPARRNQDNTAESPLGGTDDTTAPTSYPTTLGPKTKDHHSNLKSGVSGTPTRSTRQLHFTPSDGSQASLHCESKGQSNLGNPSSPASHLIPSSLTQSLAASLEAYQRTAVASVSTVNSNGSPVKPTLPIPNSTIQSPPAATFQEAHSILQLSTASSNSRKGAASTSATNPKILSLIKPLLGSANEGAPEELSYEGFFKRLENTNLARLAISPRKPGPHRPTGEPPATRTALSPRATESCPSTTISPSPPDEGSKPRQTLAISPVIESAPSPTKLL